MHRGVFKEFHYIDSLKGFRQIRNPFARAVKRKFPKFQRRAEQAVRTVIEEKNIDVLHLHLLPIGLLLANLKVIPRVLDLTDSVTLYAVRMFFPLRKPVPLRFLLHCYYLTRAIWNERFVLKKYEIVTVVSPKERYYLLKLNRRANVQVIQLGVAIEKAVHVTRAEDHPSIIFFGNMSVLPNIDAVLYLVHEILPLLKSKIPEVKLYIVGAHPSKAVMELGKHKDVVVTGFVDDITEYITKASIALFPMRKGGGQLFKILEALALGKPVVTTPIGAESFDQSVKNCLRIGENSRELAEKSLEILTDPSLRKDLGRKSAEAVRTSYTWKAIADKHERMYEQIIKSKCFRGG